MIDRRRGTPPTALLALLLIAGCGDSGSDPLIPTTVTITSGAISLSEIGEVATITATVQDQNGDNLADAELSFTSSDMAVATVSSSGVVTAVGDGSTTVTVSSGEASAEAPVDVTVSVLQEGVPLGGLAGEGENSERFFTIQIPPGAGAGHVLEFRLQGGTGDADLVVRSGAAPIPSAFDCASALDGNSEFCSVAQPESGTWHVLLLGFEAYSGVTLTAELVPITTVQSEVPLTDLSADRNDLLYFDFQVPASAPGATESPDASDSPRLILGTKPEPGETLGELRQRISQGAPTPLARQTSPPLLTARTSGGTGDVDLLGTNLGPVSLTPKVTIPCASLVDGNSEQCAVESPDSGTWNFVLWAYRAFSSVTFEVAYDPGEES